MIDPALLGRALLPFEVLMDAMQICSPGQICQTLFAVGSQ